MFALLKPALDSVGKRVMRAVVLTPLFFVSEDRKIAIERRLRGREQAAKLGRADVVIVSFGKSGRTWLRVMLSRFFQVKHALSERWLIGFDNLHLKNRAIPKIFFTHDNYLKDFTGNHHDKRDYYDRRVVLLVRHPADVAVSQYHQWRYRMRPHKKTINDYPEHGKDVSIFSFVAEHEAGLPKVVGFMNDWAREMDKLKQILIVRYEDMRADPAHEVDRITRFMGTPGTEAEIQEAVRYASFDNMKKLEEKRHFWLAGGRMQAKDKSNPASFKVRRGKVGGWRDYFTEEEAVQIDAIVDRTMLPGFGYTSAEGGTPAWRSGEAVPV